MTEIIVDHSKVQRAQFNSCRCLYGLQLGAAFRPDDIPVLLAAASHYQPLAGPQRVVDPADRRAPDLFRDFIEPI